MFFFVAGVQPKMRAIDSEPRRCPRCGVRQAYMQRVDHYLSLFFIPLIRVKTGEPYLFCRNCEQPVGQHMHDQRISPSHCPSCGSPLDPAYNYCPRCGQRL